MSDTIIDAFEKRVALTPNAPALIYKAEIYTYFEIKTICGEISLELVQSGIKKGDTIGIYISRSELFGILPLAVTQIGAIFVPLETNLPPSQIEVICSEARLKMIITDEINDASCFGIPRCVITKQFLCECKRNKQGKDTSLFSKVGPDDLMCIFFTSGSTGIPKGVMHKHRSVYYMIVSDGLYNNTTNDDAVLYYMNFGFLFGHRVFQAVIAGAPLHIAPEETLQDFQALNRYMENNRITITIMPTQVAYLFCSQTQNKSLRILEIGGSPIPNFEGNRNFDIYSAYGSTECLSAFNVVVDNNAALGLIGKPNNKTEYRIMSDNPFQPNRGELLVSGPGLSCGYLNDNEKTQERFISLGDSVYFRTGDIVMEDEHGDIIFISRIDEMVKVHGLRIELNEIDNALMQYPTIEQSVTCVKSNGCSEILCSYYSSRDGRPIASKLLKDFLTKRLHSKKIPSFFIWQKIFPLSPRGKIDREQLPMPSFITTEYEAPKNTIEKDVAFCYWKILGLKESVGRNDNFIELGGDSLGQILLVGELSNLGYSVSFQNAVENPIVKELAANMKMMETSSSIESDNCIVYGNSLLTNTLYYNDKEQINQFNINDIFKLRDRVDMPVLRKAINALVEKHPMLRAIVNNVSLYVRPFVTDALFTLTEASLSNGNEYLEIQKYIQELLNNKDVFSKGMLDLILFHTSNADYLYISCSHIVSDAISKKIIAEDISNLYDCIKQGNKVPSSLEKKSYRLYYSYYNSLENLIFTNRQKKYWLDIVSLFDGTNLANNMAKTDIRPSYAFSTVKLSEEESLSTIQNGFIGESIIRAIGNAIIEIYNVNRVPLGIIHHGREMRYSDGEGEDCVISFERTVGCFPYLFPIVIVANNSLKIDVRTIIDLLRSVPDKGLYYDILLKREYIPSTLPKFCFDYLGNNFDIINEYSFLQRTNDFNINESLEITNQQIDCNIYAMVKNKKLRLTARYDTNQFEKEDIDNLLNKIKNGLLVDT